MVTTNCAGGETWTWAGVTNPQNPRGGRVYLFAHQSRIVARTQDDRLYRVTIEQLYKP